MTSVIVPPVDLAPGMPSRVVTISATDVTEGGKSLEGQMVRFALSDTLDVTSGGDVIAKTQAEVVLDANGEGSIRLPVYDEAVRTWCGQDWAILVTATWGSQKAIRVPAGTSSIALSALPPVRPLRGRELQWAITGTSVSVSEGAQWDIGVTLHGGIIDFDVTVPPGGTAWMRGLLNDNTDLNSLVNQADSGVYGLSMNRAYANNPLIGAHGRLVVEISASMGGYQEVTQYGSTRRWRREMTNWYTSPRSWGAWYRIDIDHEALDETLTLAGRQFYLQGTLPDGTDLDTLNGLEVQGIHALPTSNTYVNLPPRPSPTWRGMLLNWSNGIGDVWQRVQWSHAEGVWERQQRTSGVWTEWVRTDAQWDDLRVERLEGRVELLEATAPTRTMWEQAELVSSYGAGEAYLDRLYRDHMDPRGLRYPEQYHDEVRLLDLGLSFEGRMLRAVEMGDPTKPAFMVMAAQHGDEISGREAAFIWAREIAESTDPAIVAALDAICLLIVPTVNTDRINIRRQNAQNVNLNRDWGAEPVYPEVQAVSSLFDSHDIVAVIDAHEGGSVTDAQVNYARLEEIHPDVRAASQRMYNAAWAGIEGAGLPVSEYPDSGEIDWAVGGIPARHHAATLLQENPTNSINPYHPPLQGRIDQYRASYTALLLDVAQNVQVYVDAKAASMGA